MPRELLKPVAKRESNKREPNRKQIERSQDRMIRRANNRQMKQCAQYEDARWPVAV